METQPFLLHYTYLKSEQGGDVKEDEKTEHHKRTIDINRNQKKNNRKKSNKMKRKNFQTKRQ